MRKVLAITSFQVKSLFTSPAAIVLMFIMPILFSLFFGGIGTGGTSSQKPVVLMIESNDEDAEQISNLLSSNKQYKWKKAALNEAAQLLNDQKAVAAIRIADQVREKITRKEPVFELIVQRQTQDYAALTTYVEGVGRMLIQSQQITSGLEPPAFTKLIQQVAQNEQIEIHHKIVQKDSASAETVSLLAVGFTIMFMMFGISGAASTILEERLAGTWQRLLVTPIKKAELLFGYVFSYFLMGWIQLAVLMIAMKLIYQAEWGRLSYFIPFATLIILTIVGFGLMIAGLVKTKQQAGAAGTVLIVSTCMLGGVYWPLEIVPEFMQQLSLAVPQRWMIDGLREIISGSLYTPVMLKSTFALMGFCIVFFTIALRKIKFY